MRTEETKIQRLREFVQRAGILHARDLKPLGLPQRYLGRLCVEGLLRKTSSGLYMAASIPDAAQLGLAQVAKAVPKGVICLLSALRFHEIGTELPHQIWLALEEHSARPRLKNLPVRIAWYSGSSFAEGIEEHEIAGVCVRIYNPAKTVADCFKYRNKIGLDVAIEALREALRERKCIPDDLWRYATVCRVAKVMRPYLEAML